MGGFYEHCNEHSISIKGRIFVDELSDCQLFKDSQRQHVVRNRTFATGFTVQTGSEKMTLQKIN